MLQVSERRIEMSTTFEQDPCLDKAFVCDSAILFTESFGNPAEVLLRAGAVVALGAAAGSCLAKATAAPRFFSLAGVLHLVVPFRNSSRTVAERILTTVEYALGVDLGTTHTAAAV